MTLFDHPDWPFLLRRLRVQQYDRDGGHRHPRHRFEVDVRDLTPAEIARLRHIRVSCAACGMGICPVRQRNTAATSFYLSVSCELRVNLACARGRAAAATYEHVFTEWERAAA